MYTQQERQNKYNGCHSRRKKIYPYENRDGNPVNQISAFADMTNDQLLSQTKTLVQKERQINVLVLQHLQEIEKRKLYLDRGFPSLFEYAIKELGYSHSAAYRRIKAMRLCRDIPQATAKIKTGNLNLTTASQLQTFFEKKKRKDKKQILNTANMLKTNNKERCNIQSTYLPATGCVKATTNEDKKKESKPENKTELDSTQKLDLIKKAENQSSRELEKTLFDIDPEVCNEREKIRHINNNKVEIKIVMGKDCQQKLDELKKLLSHKSPNMSYGELIAVLAELGLNKYDPKRKIKKSASQTSAKQQAKKIINKHIKPTRYIPSTIRHHVWMRDQGKCTYVCPKTKRRCASNHLIQIDHIKPFSLGGTNEADNLRLLCANHNQFAFLRYQKYRH